MKGQGKILSVALILAVAGAGLLGCQKKEYPDPTPEFYCNDFADMIPEAVEASIDHHAGMLYDTYEGSEIGGTQVVFATFAVQNEIDIGAYNKADLYNQWEIGENDLGILILYFYVGEDPEDPSTLSLKQVQVEIGYQMTIYLTPGEAGRIVDETILSDESEEIGTAHLLFEMLSLVYEEVYDDVGYDWDEEVYQEYLDSYVPDDDLFSDTIWSLIFAFFFESGSGWLGKGLLFVVIVILLGAGGGVLGRVVGGGGHSGGAGIFRRRR